jgi:hypothetical protein
MSLLIANIFKRNLNKVDDETNLSLVEEFEKGHVQITESFFKCITVSNIEYMFKISQTEDEIFTKTFQGQFPNGKTFRLIIPTELALSLNEDSALNEVCGGFTFSGLDRTGWAVSFYLSKKGLRFVDTKEDSQIEMLKNHVFSCLMAIHTKDASLIMEITNKLLFFIENKPELILRVDSLDREKILRVLRGNSHRYNKEHQKLIDELSSY